MSARAKTVGAVVALLVLVLLGYLVGPGGDAGPSTVTPAGSPSAARASRDPETGLPLVSLAGLPVEAQRTVSLIDAGGPFPYAKDGSTFANRERLLPAHPSGWYREYTVVTPGSADRGARRIITGDRGRQLFWTADHYASFARIQAAPP